MKPEVLSLLNWEEVKEIVTAADEIGPEIAMVADERSYYRAVLRKVMENNIDKKQRHYLYLIKKAEKATGCKATRKRTYDSVITRSFVSYRLWKEGMTYMEIGRITGKDHTTIINQVRKVADMNKLPKMYARELEMYSNFENSLNDGDDEE